MLFMFLSQRLGIGSSAVAFASSVGGIIDHSGTMPYKNIATVAIITAIGSMVGPWVMAIINKYFDRELQELKYTVSELQKRADAADEIEQERDEAKLEVVRYQERLRHLEHRVDNVEPRVERNTATVSTVAEVVRKKVLSVDAKSLHPVASVVTDAYGKILTASASLEFILQWKPHELIGRNITEIIPKPLHPDPVSHESRSFNPEIEFNERTVKNVDAIAKDGLKVRIDVRLTRWFEKGQRSITGVRFGKMIRKHQDTDPDMPVLDFPPIGEMIPGIPLAEELAKNSEKIAENNDRLKDVNEKLDVIIGDNK